MSSPPVTANLALQLDAMTGVFNDAGVTPATDGQTVQQWNDQSGNGKNATQATSGQRPTYVANLGGRPAILFAGASNTQLKTGANADFTSSAFTIFAVVDWTGHKLNIGADVAGQCILNKGDGQAASNSVWELRVGLTATQPSQYGSALFETFFGSTLNSDMQQGIYAGSDTLLTGIRVSNSVKHGYVNGSLVATGGDSGNSLNSGATPLGVGSDGSDGTRLPYTGYIREILYYSAALNDTDRASVETYLINKWNVNVPITQIMSSFAAADGIAAKHLYALQSSDALNWTTPSGVTNPTFTPFGIGGVGNSSGTSGQDLILYNGNYYWAYEINNLSGSVDRFGIAIASSLAGPWTWLTDVVILPNATNGFVWNPRWIVDDSNNLYIICNAVNGSNISNPHPMQPFIVHPRETDLTLWSTATKITGVTVSTTCLAADMIDLFLLSPGNSPNGLWNLFYKDDNAGNSNAHTIHHATSSSMVANFNDVSQDVFGTFGTPIEGIYLRKYGNTWRAFVSYPEGSSSTGTNNGAWSYFDSADNWTSWSLQATKTLGPGIQPAGEALLFQFIPPPPPPPTDYANSISGGRFTEKGWAPGPPAKHYTRQEFQHLKAQLAQEADQRRARDLNLSDMQKAKRDAYEAQMVLNEAETILTQTYTRGAFDNVNKAKERYDAAQDRLNEMRSIEYIHHLWREYEGKRGRN